MTKEKMLAEIDSVMNSLYVEDRAFAQTYIQQSEPRRTIREALLVLGRSKDFIRRTDENIREARSLLAVLRTAQHLKHHEQDPYLKQIADLLGFEDDL